MLKDLRFTTTRKENRMTVLEAGKPPVLFCRIGWCTQYDGSEDPIRGGAGGGNDHERANFKPFKGTCYGCFTSKPHRTVYIEKLGAARRADSVPGVLVVFFATRPKGGQVVVGWYRNATVYRKLQESPGERPERSRGKRIRKLEYMVTAHAANSTQLDVADRQIDVPAELTGAAGHYYPDMKMAAWRRLVERIDHAIGEKFGVEDGATTDYVELLRRAHTIIRSTANADGDAGTDKPTATEVKRQEFKRSPRVVAQVLGKAEGRCDLCKRPSPFVDANDEPYLEVHHVRLLSEGGVDRVYNAVAVCPNCHRELHFGAGRKDLIKRLYRIVRRLRPR
jgi:5-methylcytosine-specific restriction endonuclease McrA